MGSITLIVVGAASLAATIVLLQYVRPKQGRPAPAWTQSDAASTFLALALVVGAVFGIALIVAGILA